MRCGISTSCYFPEDTLVSLKHVTGAAAPVTEVFLNTFSETEPDYVGKLDALRRESGIEVCSLHPFSSMLDGFFFASPYAARMRDGIALYRRYYEVCNLFGADKLVFHGDYAQNVGHLSLEEYAANFRALAEVGRGYGVALLHENMFYCRLKTPEDVRHLRPLMGEIAAFVLDTKQVRRAGQASPREMVNAMAGAIRHVHISDYTDEKDCVLPGRGKFDFKAFIAQLRETGYDGDLVIEVYSDSFSHPREVAEAMEYVQSLI